MLAEVDPDTYVEVDMTWEQGTRTTTQTAPRQHVNASRTDTVTVTPTAAGELIATVDWEPYRVRTDRSASVSTAGSREEWFEVSGNGLIEVFLTWEPAALPENLDLELVDNSGNVVASSTGLVGSDEYVYFTVDDIDYPRYEWWRAPVGTIGSGTDYDVTIRSPETPDVDLAVGRPRPRPDRVDQHVRQARGSHS